MVNRRLLKRAGIGAGALAGVGALGYMGYKALKGRKGRGARGRKKKGASYWQNKYYAEFWKRKFQKLKFGRR